jgi:hypothetical protein
MTQEDKELLLKELSARLPYGVICYWRIGSELTLNLTEYNGQLTCINKVEIEDSSDYYYDCYFNVCNDSNGNSFQNEDVPIGIVKPYLRPMSSMTEEEKKEYGKVCELDTEILANHPMNGEPFPALYNSQDWLNKKMFAYRTIDGKDMFELGLALEAPEGMYKI